MIVVVFALFGLNFVSPQHITPGSCPDRPIEQNFDLQKYVSQKWYEQYRYEAIFQKDCSCSRAIYTLNSDNTVTVNNCCKKPDGNDCSTGKAILTDPDHVPLEGKLNVAFGGKPNNSSNYWVLSTDYEKYSIVYLCKNIAENKMEFAWIISSTPQLDDSVKNTVNDLIDKYFDRSALITVNQSDDFCSPRP